MTQQSVIHRFKHYYANMLAAERAELDGIYAADVCFRDPIHQVNGRQQLYHYFNELCENLTRCEFEFLDEALFADKAYLKWIMYFSHPRLGKQLLAVRGVSHLEYDETGIRYHEDFYDMGAMLYENLPVVGAGVRWLKQRLAS